MNRPPGPWPPPYGYSPGDTLFVAQVPEALGRVTKLEKKGDHIIARTESGVPMIVPKQPKL